MVRREAGPCERRPKTLKGEMENKSRKPADLIGNRHSDSLKKVNLLFLRVISHSVAAVSGSCTSTPLPAEGDPPVILASRRWRPTYIALIHSTWSPGQTSLKFSNCYFGKGANEHFFLAKEASCAAFSCPPSSPGNYDIVFALWLGTPL